MSSPRTDAIPPVVLLHGMQAALRDAALEEYRDRVLGSGPRDWNEDVFDLSVGGTDPARIAAAARTHPVSAPARLVVVRGMSDRRATRFTDRALSDYLSDPSPTTCLVLLADRIDKRQTWVRAVAKAGVVRECKGPTRAAEVRAWVDARFKALDRKPERGVAAALVERVGNDLDGLALEIDKACLFAGDRTSVGPDDVAEVTGDLRPRALYELTDALGERRVADALRVTHLLCDQGEAPLAILGALANHFRRLLRARECRPLKADEVQRRLSLHPFAARKLTEQARRFDRARLRNGLTVVRRTDLALKGGEAVAPRLALERLVLAVCR